MSVFWALFSVVCVMIYARLDYYFAHAEEASDKAFADAIKRCTRDKLTNKDKEAYDTLVKYYESKYVGFLFVFILLLDLPRQIIAVFVPEKRKRVSIKDKNLIMAVHYWSKSHVYRNTFAAIICYILLSIHSFMMTLRLEDSASEVFDGHAEDAVLLRASRQLKRSHYLERLAA